MFNRNDRCSPRGPTPDTAPVDPSIWHFVIAALVGLAYLLVTCTLAALAYRVRSERRRHDLIRASRLRRQEYLDTLSQRGDSTPAY